MRLLQTKNSNNYKFRFASIIARTQYFLLINIFKIFLFDDYLYTERERKEK
jgi:hypothetical protein